MRCIDIFREGIYIADVYLCENRQIAPMRNGKECSSLVIQDRTDVTDAKIWDSGSLGVGEFEAIDHIHVEADTILPRNSFQLNVRQIRRAQEGKYMEAGYLPVSRKSVKKTYEELLGYIRGAKSPYLQKLLCGYFVEDVTFAKAFQFHSVVKTVHHGFVGDLLEHTLNVIGLCGYYAEYYSVISRDSLLTTAIFHDVGKTRELSRFPESDHTGDEQLLDHIIVGTEMVGENVRSIPGFPGKLATEFKYCILARHEELEYGLLERPALLEALVLNFTDNTGIKMKTMIETLRSGRDDKGWLGYNRLLGSNIRKTTEWALKLNNKEK